MQGSIHSLPIPRPFDLSVNYLEYSREIESLRNARSDVVMDYGLKDTTIIVRPVNVHQRILRPLRYLQNRQSRHRLLLPRLLQPLYHPIQHNMQQEHPVLLSLSSLLPK